MIEFVNVNTVQSKVFSMLTPTSPVLVSEPAWVVEYRGAKITFHNEAEMQRYIDAKLSPVSDLQYASVYPVRHYVALAVNHVQVGYVPIIHPFAQF